MKKKFLPLALGVAAIAIALLIQFTPSGEGAETKFEVMETTIADVHKAYESGALTARQLTQMYLDRIEAYDQNGPKINCIITINPKALEDADMLDAAFEKSGMVGPLHGIPVVLKDQMDAVGMPTTLGSVVLKDNVPTKDSFVAAKLREAGAIILAKVTLGEMGGGDTYGSLFGETRNPYDLLRTAGGSSGGTGAGVAANFATIGIGQEASSSIRRPSTWNSIVGMRPTPGLVSRTGVWAGWPSVRGSLGPMARTVTDLARLLDVMVGYDPEDPVTALGVGHAPGTYTDFLQKDGLKGARIGILRESIGQDSEPDSEDFKNVTVVFDRAVAELRAAGAELVDPVVIPRIKELMAGDTSDLDAVDSTAFYFSRNPNAPFKTREELLSAPDYAKVFRRGPSSGRSGARAGRGGSGGRGGGGNNSDSSARERLLINIMKVMADHKLDAIVHKSVEHTATLIKDGINPPYVNHKGSPRLNTFLVHAASIAVPAGFTPEGLPVGITFFGKPYSEPEIIKLAYAYEQATNHRSAPETTPALEREMETSASTR